MDWLKPKIPPILLTSSKSCQWRNISSIHSKSVPLRGATSPYLLCLSVPLLQFLVLIHIQIDIDFYASFALLRKLIKGVDPPPITKEEADNRSLIYGTFLATPLLPFGKPGFIEDKWSGTNQTGDNETAISRALAAFAHHSVVDSNRTCVLVDLQGLVSPDGAITLIDPQAHTYVARSFMIYTTTNAQYLGPGRGVLATMIVDSLGSSSSSRNIVAMLSVSLSGSRSLLGRKAFIVNGLSFSTLVTHACSW
jgi:hypothetical protein